MEYATLNNGAKIPLLGFGTWKSAPGEVKGAVMEAIKVGYRHIDCAQLYANEGEVGDAIKECIDLGLCKRSDLFITSKLWNDKHLPNDVPLALDVTLSNLKLDYLDMYLMHFPIASKTPFPVSKPEEFYTLDEVPILSTWKAMEQCVKSGKTKGIGVSNFSIKKLDDLLSKCTIPPAINQIERHPYLNQQGLVDYCKSKGIHVTGYSGLGSLDRPASLKTFDEPVLIEDVVIGEIANKHCASPAQILLQWAMQTGASTIPKSVKPHRILENLLSIDHKLTADEITKINNLNKNRRYLPGTPFTFPGSPYTMDNLWD